MHEIGARICSERALANGWGRAAVVRGSLSQVVNKDEKQHGKKQATMGSDMCILLIGTR